MAVWIFAYGRNGFFVDNTQQSQIYLDILNRIELDEVKILDSIVEATANKFSVRKYYTANRKKLEDHFKKMPNQQYIDYLTSIGLPYIATDKIIDYFINDGEKREREEIAQFKSIYNKFKLSQIKSGWEVTGRNILENKFNLASSNDGLSINLINDLIKISGPFSVFSVYSCFQKTISFESREYYHTYFKKICKAFKSDFILYAHEWSGLEDEEDKDYNLSKLKEQSNWDKNSSDSIHTMETFYYENLNLS